MCTEELRSTFSVRNCYHATEMHFQKVDCMKPGILTALDQALKVGPAAAAQLERFCELVQYPAGSVIYFQEDPTTHFHILISGYVRLTYINENGMVTLLSVVPAGQSFGEAGAFDGSPNCDTSFTIGPAEVLHLDLNGLKHLGELSHGVHSAIANVIAKRYRDHVHLTRALYLPNLSLRLAHVLLQLAATLGNRIRYKGEMLECLGPIITQQDLGSMARGTRENVNKTLRSWEKQGIIALEDRHILLCDKTRLENIAANAD